MRLYVMYFLSFSYAKHRNFSCHILTLRWDFEITQLISYSLE